MRRVKCGVGGSQSESFESEDELDEEEEPEDELRQNRHPPQVEFDRLEPAVEESDDPDELLLEDEELLLDEEDDDEFDPRRFLRLTFRRADLTLLLADLLLLPVLPLATDSALFPFRRRLLFFGAGV